MDPFTAAAERRGTPADLLVVGLGNPGLDYANTRHNAGADCIGVLADRHRTRLTTEKHERADLATAVLGAGTTMAIAIPTTFYNEAGIAVGALVKRFGITEPDRVVIVHDELDIDPGRLKVKVGGGLAGNNGLKSIKGTLRTDAFLRVRIGVGKPPGSQQGKDHLLRRPGKQERELIAGAIVEAADAVEMIAEHGVERAMERYNRRA